MRMQVLKPRGFTTNPEGTPLQQIQGNGVSPPTPKAKLWLPWSKQNRITTQQDTDDHHSSNPQHHALKTAEWTPNILRNLKPESCSSHLRSKSSIYRFQVTKVVESSLVHQILHLTNWGGPCNAKVQNSDPSDLKDVRTWTDARKVRKNTKHGEHLPLLLTSLNVKMELKYSNTK